MYTQGMVILIGLAVVFGMGRIRADEGQTVPKVLHIGVVGYEGHGSVWTNDLNGGVGDVIGLKVSHVWHKAPIDPEAVKKYGFDVVGKPEDMIGQVDGVIIAEELPHRYRELAEPFIRAGMRTFLNRPLAASAKDAAAIIRLGRQCNNPVFAASLLAVDPSVTAVREQRKQYEPLKIVNVTGPSDHFWWYVPHAISALATALGPGIEEVQTHDFAWAQEGVTFRDPLVVFFRYGEKSDVGPVRGTIQIVSPSQSEDWYGFRMKLYGHKESPEYVFFQTPSGESVWMPIYKAMIPFFREGKIPLSDEELLEVPLVLDMILKSGLEKRLVTRAEYADVLKTSP